MTGTDFTILCLCAIAIGICYYRMAWYHCRHDEFDWNTMLCWNCGISARALRIMSMRGLARPSPYPSGRVKFTSRKYPHPMSGLWLNVRAIPAPPDSPYSFYEEEFPDPDNNTPEQIETYNQMVSRR